MTLNKLVFDVLVKEKLKMERNELAQFIYESLPNNKTKQLYSQTKIEKSVSYIFEI